MKKTAAKTEKFVSLNKMLTTTAIIAYIVFLLLLFWMDAILVINYRRERLAEERQQVSAYADTLDEHLGRIEELLYDIYAYNEDFANLNGSQTELQEFDSVYEINYIMRNRISLYQWINGYMLSYHGTEKWRYFFENSEVDSDCTDEMKKFVVDQMRSGEDWKRHIVRFGERTYCFVFCGRENVSLCGVYDLTKSVQSHGGIWKAAGKCSLPWTIRYSAHRRRGKANGWTKSWPGQAAWPTALRKRPEAPSISAREWAARRFGSYTKSPSPSSRS